MRYRRLSEVCVVTLRITTTHKRQPVVSDLDEGTLALAEAIECYLKNHPDAKDSLSGVANWWLSERRYYHSKDEVKAALDYLVYKGVLTCLATAKGHHLYSVKQHHKNDT